MTMYRMLFLLLCLFHSYALFAVSQTSLMHLNGDQFVTQKLQIDNEFVIHDKGRSALNSLARITRQGDNVDWSNYNKGILLHDGSWIPISILAAGEKDDTIQASTPFGPLTIPLEYVAAWGSYHLLKHSDEHDFIYTIHNTKPYGELHGINGGKLLLQTDLADEPLAVPLEDIVAVRLRTQEHASNGLYFNVYTNPDKPPMKVLPGQQPSLALIPSITFENWDQCQHMQVIGGKRVFLSELRPGSVEEKSLFGKTWHYAKNTNIDGSPLYLNKKRYQYGLVVHSYAKLTWDLGEAYASFHSQIGISDQLKREGDCIVRIYADGKLVWHKENVRGAQPAEKVKLDLSGVKLLSIEVDYGERYDIGDHVAFAGAYLSK